MHKNIIITFLAVLTVVGFGWGFYESRQTAQAATRIENDASRAYYELMDAADELSVLTAKALVVSDGDRQAELCSEISRTAYVAQENLSMLPVYHGSFSRTERFLNQLGDFSASLVTKAARGEGFTAKELSTMESLNSEMTKTAKALHDLENGEDNAFSYKAILAAEKSLADDDMENAGLAVSSLHDITASAEKTPALIYDGPYSDHLENKGPVTLSGEPIRWADAKIKAKELLGKGYVYEAHGKSSEDAAMAVYTIAVKERDDDDAFGYLDISVNGGHIVQYTAESENGKAVITKEDALSKAAAFLEKAGYSDMKAGYHLTKNNVLTANFMAQIDDVTVYPDMVKVSVDLSNGQVVGLDAKNYLEFHKDRTLPSLILTAEAASSYLPGGCELHSVQKALIPKNNGTEVLCYELHFTRKNTEYLLYINAESGKEEDVFIVKDDQSGTFTQ
ncbi:MAG: germination protein YpeB [Firmicutes bacterium]|nr:germination protein YpeB [Bacillota bacterium]